MRIVTGPGTGFGQAYLVKGEFAPCYEVFASEGGHVDFPARSQEDWDLVKFAYNYIESSNNVENLRGKCKPTRMSIERVCAGPAVPMIYEFYKEKNSVAKADCVLENGDNAKTPDQITAEDIVIAAFNKENPDQLCRQVVEKFAEILAVEVGNHALKTLPYGGIFLIGGVTQGINELILKDDRFMDLFYAKGRLSDMMNRFPVYLVKPDVELGLLGAEECAFRRLSVYQ